MFSPKIESSESTEMDNKKNNLKSKKINGKKNFIWSIRITNFLQDISVIGIKYTLMQNASFGRRFFWVLLILFGVGFMIFQLQERIHYYRKFDTTTRITYTHRKSLRFPTVTICNENRMLKSIVEENGLLI